MRQSFYQETVSEKQFQQARDKSLYLKMSSDRAC